jgi:integrase
MHQIAMDIALLTGLRREDILNLDRDADTEDGLLVLTGKTGKHLLFRWSEELRAAVDRAWAVQPKVHRYLICTRGGKRYTGDGFSVIWRRARDRAIEAGELATPFRFNDIRAKSASDDDSADRASRRLGHTSRQTTERFYIRKPKKVEPLR